MGKALDLRRAPLASIPWGQRPVSPLRASSVLTRSEAGKNRLYAVPEDQRGCLRLLTREYRRWQRARARLVKQSATLVARVDQMAEYWLRPAVIEPVGRPLPRASEPGC